MNSVHLIGTVRFAPRFKSFESGLAKTTAIIETPPAPGRQYGDKIDVSAWDDEAMALADLKEGDAVEIHGRITTESWNDRETGKKVYKQVCVATSVASPSRTVRAASATAAAAGRFDNCQPDEEEVPF
jgi:single-stranded DNA-binding protein